MASKVAPTSKYDIINPSLEPETEEDGYDDFSWGPSLKEEKAAKAKKDAKAELLPVAKKMHVNSYRAQRNSMKERIVNEVLDAALPDSHEYDMEDVVSGTIPTTSNSKLIRFGKFIGILDLSLHEAVMSGSMAHVKKAVDNLIDGKTSKIFGVLLKPNPSFINLFDEKGQTALSLAAKMKRNDMADYIINVGGAIVDFIDQRNGMSPLMYAILNNDLEMVMLMLNNNASIDLCDFKCVTPLMLACQVNNLAIVCYLLDNYQPTLDAQDLNGFTALHYAVYSNSPEICVKLLDEGADRNVRDVNKKKPLHLAIYKNYGLCASVLEDLKSKLAMATGDNLNI